jgi:hypothetical protein
MWNDRFSGAGLSLFGRAAFDPVTLTGAAVTAISGMSGATAASMAATAVGGAVTAAGTLAAGNYAKTAGEMQNQAKIYEAKQLEENAADEIASSQRRMLDTQERARLAISTSTARAGASGVDTGVGSPAENVGELAARGSYHAAMDLWQGTSNATGLLNRSQGARYSGTLDEMGGDEAQSASELAAIGTLAGSAGSMAKTYGGKGKL